MSQSDSVLCFPTRTLSFKEAALYWLKLGFISFGGPAGQIAIMHHELVEKRKWISEQRFLHALNYTMALPGPEAQQLATYIGYLMHGVPGGIVAGALFILPSLVLLILLSWGYVVFGEVAIVQSVFYGVKPAVTAIVVFAAYKIGNRALFNKWLKIMACLAFVSTAVFKIPYPWIVIFSAVLGVVFYRYDPSSFIAKSVSHSEANTHERDYIIGDHTLLSTHTEFSFKRVGLYVFTGVVLSGGVFLWILNVSGWQGTLTHMSVFFTKAALVTFGGAYAVLPYVHQATVGHYGWLNGVQMMDGLALGETTPGPLIMIVSFVGFVGGVTGQVILDSVFLSGLAGACVATFYTFLPSFLFILIGAPLVEASRKKHTFTAPLSGITASAVGVIINLAVFFAYHVLWPKGLHYSMDWVSLIIGISAGALLFKYRLSVLKVVLFSAIAGTLVNLFY